MLKAARDANPSIYVVMITGYASIDVAVRAVWEGRRLRRQAVRARPAGSRKLELWSLAASACPSGAVGYPISWLASWRCFPCNRAKLYSGTSLARSPGDTFGDFLRRERWRARDNDGSHRRREAAANQQPGPV